MKLNILTITLGRELYLERLLESFNKLSNWQHHDFTYYIVYQGKPSEAFKTFISELPFNANIVLKEFSSDKPLSVGSIMKQFQLVNTSGIFWKLDDDSLLRSDNFIDHIVELYRLRPNCAFSPYPVGLINNPGGVLSKNHSVVFSEKTNMYYTLRQVHHLGGFARIIPFDIFTKVNFSDSHSEDTECSSYCQQHSVPMFYLENALIIEHQESTLGQHMRYGDKYFKGRF